MIAHIWRTRNCSCLCETHIRCLCIHFIQGPLVDIESGLVIGINTGRNIEGTSFSIPINQVRAIVEDLTEGKHVHHGFIGASMSTLTPERSKHVNAKEGTAALAEVYGALITRVLPQSPADLAGLKENDVVVRIGNARVQTMQDARLLIDRALVGEELTLTIVRQQRWALVNVRPLDLASHLGELRQERRQIDLAWRRANTMRKILALAQSSGMATLVVWLNYLNNFENVREYEDSGSMD